MNKPLLALAGIALLGTASIAGTVIVAPLGGEEEVVSQEQLGTASVTPTASPQTATPRPAQSPTVTPFPTASEGPTPAASVDWETYTDPMLGLSFPYPPQLVSVEEQLHPGLEGQEDQRFVIFRTAQAEFGLALVVIPVGDLALNEWVDFYTACGGDAGAQEESIVVADQEGLHCPVNQLNERNPGYFLKWQNYIIEITGNLVGSREGGGYLRPVLTDEEMQRILHALTLPKP